MMDDPQTPVPGTRRTTLATRPIRSTRLFNLGGSSYASTGQSDWTPGVATANTQDLNGGRLARYYPGAFNPRSPLDRRPSGASSLQSRPIGAGSSASNVSSMAHRGERQLTVDRSYRRFVTRVAAPCSHRTHQPVLTNQQQHRPIVLCREQHYKASALGTGTSSTIAGI